MGYQQESTRQDNLLASDNQVYGPSKELSGLSSSQDPHIHPLSTPNRQRNNENVDRFEFY